MPSKQELSCESSSFPHSVLCQPGRWLLVIGVLASACGQASPQGLDESGARPGSGVLTIFPEDPQVQSSQSIQFVLRDGALGQVDGPIRWSATGGTITIDGLYTAGASPGTYRVVAKLRGKTATQRVTVVASSTSNSPSPTEPTDSDPSGSDEDPPDDPDDSNSRSIIFGDDFESGDFKVWSSLAPAGDPQWDGGGDGGGGAHIGDGYITNEQSHTGQFAWKALLDPAVNSYGKTTKSSLERWKGMADVSEFYISAWYFIPTDYPAVQTLLMQQKSAGSGTSYKPVALYMKADRTFSIYSQILGKTLLTTRVRFPVGRWFNLTGRFVIANDGLVEAWLDGQQIASVRTDTKDNDFGYPGVGNYVLSSDWPVKCHIYIDDVKVTY